MNTKPKPIEASEPEIQTPSRITDLHRCDRETSKVAGAPRAWRRLTQLENAYLQERFGAKSSNEARDRLAAGNFFAKLWDTAQSHGRDSTEAFNFRGPGQGSDLGLAQRSALARLAAIETRLGGRDRVIIRAVCAMGHSPVEAMALAKLGKDTRVSARLCEALDSLLDAIECTEKRGRKSN